MRRIQRYNLLNVFGSMKNMDYVNALKLATLHMANPQNRKEIWGAEKIPSNKYMSQVIEKMLKSLLEDGLIQCVENDNTQNKRKQDEYIIGIEDYDLQITQKGRELLADEAMARAGNPSWYNATFGFKGTLDSAKKIDPGLFN